MKHEYTNALVDETSPYLLQHAHNPVNWEAWSPETLAKAQKENKLLLISIGYAACHWCHVMEHECFEDKAVAKVMNGNFVNIKVDREERPDVDHIYMDALQMMTGSGGWPLNIVALPDGRPFWGATYVQKQNWMQALQQLSQLYREDPEKIEGYAENMAEGIREINKITGTTDSRGPDFAKIKAAIDDWSQYFDTEKGGYNRAPKFPMPVNLNFLLHYATAKRNEALLDYVNTSMTKMAWGGIFDHVGGGFSRYSVDTKWHVPHFEKMLYDNGQLVSLYAQAYAATRKELYLETVEKTIAFVERELMSPDFGFYSSLDADSLDESSKLEEGAFYVWKAEELEQLLGKDFPIFQDYFNINDYGHWEDGNYVLIRNASKEQLAQSHGVSVEKLNDVIAGCLKILKEERDQRDRPRLDDKILSSWNGLMLKGLTDAYRYLENDNFLDLALKNAKFILNNLVKEDGGLFHNHKNGKSSINGYLEDYASVIDAFIGLYEATFDEIWLQHARDFVGYCQNHFFHPASGLFHFTSKQDDYVIRRTIETTDNVMPASNSIMAKNLFRLSRYFPEADYDDVSKRMLRNIKENLLKNTQSHANWMQLTLMFELPFYEVAVLGDKFKERASEIRSRYLPNTVLAATERESTLALLQNRHAEKDTQIYVCQHGSCQLPVTEVAEALKTIK